MNKKQIIAYLNFLRYDLTNKDEIIDYCINQIKKEVNTYTLAELKLWLICRDVYLYNYYTTYKNAGIPMITVEEEIRDGHEYLMDRKLIDE